MGVLSIFRRSVKIELGTIWAAPNLIWSNGFARNKPGAGYHPAIVERVKKDNIIVTLAPGTSQTDNRGSCVFKTKLTPLSQTSHFLLKLSMPYLIEDLVLLQNNWNGIQKLSENEIKAFKTQITWCKGVRHD